jgi:hypothetical protein
MMFLEAQPRPVHLHAGLRQICSQELGIRIVGSGGQRALRTQQARGNGHEGDDRCGWGHGRERGERLSGGTGWSYNFLFILIEKLEGHLCLFTTYLSLLTPHNGVGVNFCSIFKLQG